MFRQENYENNSVLPSQTTFDDFLFRVTRALTTGRLQWHGEETVEHDIN
jgi:hypothetical protein